MTLTPLRRHLAAAAVLSLTLALGACTSEETPTGESPSSETASPDETDEAEPSEEAADGDFLTDDELSPALLTTDDLPGGFVEEPEEDEEESETFVGTCLEEVGTLTDQPEFDSDGEAKVSFVLEGDAGQSSVQSQVESYADQDQVETAIEMFSDVVGSCSEASGTDPDGTSYDLEVLSDQTVSLAGVDEQARVAINGTLTTPDGGLELPVNIGYNVARIANNIVVIATLDIGEVGEGIVPQTDVIAQVSVDRLAEITG